jgi:hypothetical protein
MDDVELADDSYDDSIDMEIILEEEERELDREDVREVNSLRNQ